MTLNDALNELAPLKQWVAFRKVPKNGEISKPPINIHTGTGERWNTPEGMGTHEEAYTYAIMHSLIASIPSMNTGGIGFVFTENDCYAGIDLDHVLKNGKLTPEAEEIVALMDTYTELSLSGDGLHLIFKLSQSLDSLGLDITHKLPLGADSRIEIYDRAKYFTVSDKPYGEVKPIAERTQQCRQVCAKFCVKPKNTETQATTPTTATERSISSINWKYNPANYHPAGFSPVDTRTRSQDLPDSELWQRMFDSEHGRDIKALYDGDTSAYGNDHSSADLALCSYLNYWTNGDTSRIDRMFRQSGLMRDKWERKDYRDMAIARALNGKNAGSQNYSGSSTCTANDSAGFDSGAPSTGNTPNDRQDASESNHKERAGNEDWRKSVSFLPMDRYVFSSLLSDIEAFTRNSHRKSGYENIDAQLSLCDGLYVIGAISSLGKTSFCLQMADQLAQSGEPVLYFSIEHSKLELAARSISRLTAIDDLQAFRKPQHGISAINIRRGCKTESLRTATQKYQQFAKNLVIVPCGFDVTIDDIIKITCAYIRTEKLKPVIFVDYLQCIKSDNDKLTEKQITDAHIQQLKQLSRDEGLAVIAISSFNRENYSTLVDFTSFANSSGIEYTADVLIGMQLLAMNTKLFADKGEQWLKRKFIRECNEKNPRQVELIALKNRFGKNNLRFFFDYFPAFDYFRPDDTDVEDLEAMINEDYEAFKKKIEDKKSDDDDSGNSRYSKGHKTRKTH